MIRNLRKVPSNIALRGLHTSSQSPNPTHLLNTAQTHYSAMTVSSLKGELRSRGLKISGRKSQLVERLAANDMRREFSSTAQTAAKDDDSHIDYFKLPDPPAKANTVKVRIPILPHHDDVADTIETKEPQRKTPDASASHGEVFNIGQNDVSHMNVEMGTSKPEEKPKLDAEFTSRDKSVLYGLLAGIVALWAGDSIWKKENKH